VSLNRVIGAVLLAEAFAVSTFAFGWWTVPALAALYSIASTNPKRARTAGLCALAGWGTLLLLDFAKGPVAEMGHRLGGVMGLPSIVLYVLTLLFPALLAWSAARLIPPLRGSSQSAPSS
jgi:hypothetical protein